MAAYQVHRLSTFNTRGETTSASCISPLGGVAGYGEEFGFSEPSSPGELPSHHVAGEVWTPGSPGYSLKPYIGPSDTATVLYGINATGLAVGVRGALGLVPATLRALMVKAGTVIDISGPLGPGSSAFDVNSSGLVCGNVVNGRAFIYDSKTGSVVARIDPLAGATESGAAAINDTGETAGVAADRCCHWRQGVTADLGPAKVVGDINAQGLICGSVSGPAPQHFVPGVWDSKQPSLGFTEIPLPVGFEGGHALGMNDFGVIVGTCWTHNGQQSAYIYRNGASTDLNTLIPPTSGWHLGVAKDINNRGDITGNGRWHNTPRAFALSLPPTHVPDFVALLLVGAITAGGAGLAILPGGPRPVDPSGPVTFLSLPASKRDALIALALDEAARSIGDAGARASIRRAALEAARERINALLESGEYREGASLVQEDVTPGLDASVPVANLESGMSPIDLLRYGIRRNT